MANYDDEYFFIVKDEENSRLPSLKPDKNTAERRYDYEPPVAGTAPLIFFNGWKDEFRRDGVKDDVTNILFAGANFVVRDHIRERLLPFKIPNLTMHPSIYIDDEGDWHEDFWFLTFHTQFDCWDRDQSNYMPGTSTRFMVFDYSLDKKVLDSTPLQQRLLFQLGGTIESRVLCHSSLAPIFRENGRSGAALKGVRDYV